MEEITRWQDYCFKPENALNGNSVRLLRNGDEAFAEILKVLRDGFRKAVEDPDYIALMDKMALPRAYMEFDKFGDFLAGMEKSLEPTLGLVGLLKK